MNNHYAKFEYTGMKTVGIIDYTQITPSKNSKNGVDIIMSKQVSEYEGCSNMNASSFITFFTYMLRQNAIPFWKELFVAFKMIPNIKKHSLYFMSYRPKYKGHSCILKFSEANCNVRFGTSADIVAYL